MISQICSLIMWGISNFFLVPQRSIITNNSAGECSTVSLWKTSIFDVQAEISLLYILGNMHKDWWQKVFFYNEMTLLYLKKVILLFWLMYPTFIFIIARLSGIMTCLHNYKYKHIICCCTCIHLTLYFHKWSPPTVSRYNASSTIHQLSYPPMALNNAIITALVSSTAHLQQILFFLVEPRYF